ncbi:DUF2170 family protein [Billgrantia sp. Q4P2]|uniref:DUF2170 family protein n=1 Tax=Billgrantia sp. Q4P2 TaxID=3463857 RepID=UPI0040562948
MSRSSGFEKGAVSIQHLFTLLSTAGDGELNWPCGQFALDEKNSAITMVLSDYADLTATISHQETQWMVSAPIAPVDSIQDRAGFNDAAMRMGVMLPLASIGITDIDGKSYYVAYGQLYSDSKLASICSEIHATASAAIQLAEMITEEYV